MLKKLFYGLAVGGALVLVAYLALSMYSRRAPPLGLMDGRLRPCAERPNCVCSEPVSANVEPLRFDGLSAQAWERLNDAVLAQGGQVRQRTRDYLHATFESTYFRFVDDFEARLDEANNLIHLRSASRVGYGDRGVNRARVEALRVRFGASAALQN